MLLIFGDHLDCSSLLCKGDWQQVNFKVKLEIAFKILNETSQKLVLNVNCSTDILESELLMQITFPFQV